MYISNSRNSFKLFILLKYSSVFFNNSSASSLPTSNNLMPKGPLALTLKKMSNYGKYIEFQKLEGKTSTIENSNNA